MKLESPDLRPQVFCDTPDCQERALMRIGPTNYCPRHYNRHYKPAAPRMTDNPVCNEIRAAYAKSQMAQKKAGAEQHIAAHIEREPGSDDEEVFA